MKLASFLLLLPRLCSPGSSPRPLVAGRRVPAPAPTNSGRPQHSLSADVSPAQTPADRRCWRPLLPFRRHYVRRVPLLVPPPALPELGGRAGQVLARLNQCHKAVRTTLPSAERLRIRFFRQKFHILRGVRRLTLSPN